MDIRHRGRLKGTGYFDFGSVGRMWLWLEPCMKWSIAERGRHPVQHDMKLSGATRASRLSGEGWGGH